MSRRGRNGGSQTDPKGGRIVPILLTLRLDISLQTGGERKTPATRITWASPRDGARWVKGLEVLLIPN